MPLTIPEAIGFVPKTTAVVMKAVEKVSEVKALPAKTAKAVGGVLGIAPGSFCDDLLGLIDDIVAAAAS